MPMYQKKPVIIEAMKVEKGYPISQTFMKAIQNGTIKKYVAGETGEFLYYEIETLEGTMQASLGDYIICGVKGEFYPCKPDIFEMTYEQV